MVAEFRIDFPNWEGPIHGVPEVAGTAARMSLTIDRWIATRAEDDWSLTTRNDVLLSGYPLALWFASSWWRLRWEPLPDHLRKKPLSWRMAHELPAAGHGFVWPSLMFACDGEDVYISCRESEPDSKEPVRYLTRFQTTITAKKFEKTIDEFVNTILARLDALDLPNSDLKPIWAEVRRERTDPTLSFWRQLEARLGFDPGEAPERVMDELSNLALRSGGGAIAEVASGIANADPLGTLGRVLELAERTGISGRIQLPRQLFAYIDELRGRRIAAWERGRRLARTVRTTMGLDGLAISSATLGEILEIPEKSFEGEQNSSIQRLPMGLTIQEERPEQLRFLFRRRNRPDRRFEAARFLGDWLLENQNDHWFPDTDARTARQKVQRAFAAEFLCPIDALDDFLSQDYSDDRIEEAANYFDVSTRMILSHLVNHHMLSRDWLDWDEATIA